MSLFNTIKEGLSRTRDGLFGGIAAAIGGKAALSGSDLAALEEQLLLADVGVAATERLLASIKQSDGKMPAIDALKKEMRSILSTNFDFRPLDFARGDKPKFEIGEKPQVWLIAGINGSGKTTSIGKLSHRLVSEGKKAMLAAADTYRAAAIDQLRLWAERTGSEFVGSQPGADPASVAFDAVAAAQARGVDMLLVDTAGRLHTQRHLRDELAKVAAAIGKKMPGAPHRTLLVLDATTGQNALSQAKLFSDAVRIDGIILAKLDGTAKGGIVLAIAQELRMPVAYVGTGEGVEDLRPFDAGEFVDGMFG